MKPMNPGGHPAYQKFVVTQLKQYYPDAFQKFPPSTWSMIDKFFYLDLSEVDIIMADRYSVFGPAPRLPSCMLRSMLVALYFQDTSFTSWSREMKLNPLAAILSGFAVGDTPGTGTFYDFCSRLWLSSSDNLYPHAHFPKKKPDKPKNKGEKAAPVEKLSVGELIQELKKNPPSDNQPYARLFCLFHDFFLKHSENLGLIDLQNLVLSGDGTPVETAARERSRPLPSGKRYYSQPDTDIGYDSSRDRFYNGYDLYLMTSADSVNDLPVFPLLNPASMHDSFGVCHTYASMMAFLKECHVSEALLDSAHDVMAIYRFCQENDISAFIDLNERKGVNFKYKDNFTIGKDGIPKCEAGLKMIRDGTEKSRGRIKYRCPNVYHCDGIHCDHKCSDSPYGRVVHVATKDNPRIFTIPPRKSKGWKEKYKKRTSSERCNKRIKEDFLLENGSHRSTKLWYCRLYCIMMCLHLDAWGSAPSTSLKDIFAQAA